MRARSSAHPGHAPIVASRRTIPHEPRDEHPHEPLPGTPGGIAPRCSSGRLRPRARRRSGKLGSNPDTRRPDVAFTARRSTGPRVWRRRTAVVKCCPREARTESGRKVRLPGPRTSSGLTIPTKRRDREPSVGWARLKVHPQPRDVVPAAARSGIFRNHAPACRRHAATSCRPCARRDLVSTAAHGSSLLTVRT
jgi:hypothetical protein